MTPVTLGRGISALLLLVATACSPEPGSLTAEEVTAYAALPGQPSGVAYFSLENSANSALTLLRVTSPDFAKVEMHTTLVDGGQSRMMYLDSLTIAGHSGIVFAAGGPHLMLMQPSEGLSAGDTITLEFHYRLHEHAVQAEARLLAVRAPLMSR